MGWDLGLNELDPGDNLSGPWGQMAWALDLNGLGPGSKWAVLELNGLVPWAKWAGPWG